MTSFAFDRIACGLLEAIAIDRQSRIDQALELIRYYNMPVGPVRAAWFKKNYPTHSTFSANVTFELLQDLLESKSDDL